MHRIIHSCNSHLITQGWSVVGYNTMCDTTANLNFLNLSLSFVKRSRICIFFASSWWACKAAHSALPVNDIATVCWERGRGELVDRKRPYFPYFYVHGCNLNWVHNYCGYSLGYSYTNWSKVSVAHQMCYTTVDYQWICISSLFTKPTITYSSWFLRHGLSPNMCSLGLAPSSRKHYTNCLIVIRLDLSCSPMLTTGWKITVNSC